MISLSACSALDGEPDPGPLHQDSSDETWRSCTAENEDHQHALGFTVLRNPSKHAAHLTDVSLVGAKNVRMVEAFVVGIVDRTTVGLQEWPPGRVASTQAWDDRVAADQATIPSRGEDKNLVVHLETSALPASLSGLRISYQLDGDDYSYVTPTSLEIKEACF